MSDLEKSDEALAPLMPPKGGVLANFDPDDLFDEEKRKTIPEWQKVLFEIFLRSPAVHNKFSLGEFAHTVNEAKETAGPTHKDILEVYRFLPTDIKEELKQAFFLRQSTPSVDELSAYDEDLLFPEKYDVDQRLFPEIDGFCARMYRCRVISSRVDCNQRNRTQGYWSIRAILNPRWLIRSLYDLVGWYMYTAIPALWSTILVLYLLVSGMVQLRMSYPSAMYCIYALVWCFLVVQFYKFLRHLFGWGKWNWETWRHAQLEGGRYGFETWWEDTTVEKTYPGMVRCFSLDYWSIAWACLLWITLDASGGWGALWTIFTSACPQLCFAMHCSLSSPVKQEQLGYLYIGSGVVWFLLWLPAQMKYVYSKAGEEGRKVLGEINPNIAFMTNSIIGVFAVVVPEVAAFLYHKDGLNLGLMATQAWLAVALLGEFAHIGMASLIVMGIAKLTATPERVGFDEYGLCLGDGWFHKSWFDFN